MEVNSSTKKWHIDDYGKPGKLFKSYSAKKILMLKPVVCSLYIYPKLKPLVNR